MSDERTLVERVAAVQRWLEPFVLSGAAKAADHAQVLRDLQAEIERLALALKKQAASALMGMDAAKAIAASNVREAARLYAESNPSAIDSERTANQLLTDEIDSLRRDLEAARAELADRREHMRRGMKTGVNTARARGEEA